MAKRAKEEEEEEEGHSNPGTAEEVSPPPPKKSKKSSEKKPEKKPGKTKGSTKDSSPSDSSGKKGNVAKNVFTNADGEKFVDLGKKRRVTVRSFKGSVLVDIREFYGKDDDLQPGKKGISLSPEQWAELKANADTIDGLVKKLQT
ncbi:PC4-domain-containing protein [Sanghuangporus baumii]|uniref:PC4-domain-containing protein n=1 Tax=Sanghuangporus baumii TaxID=108892 RepID=A0A9Q5I2T9_SANBA|nr:PC4-domain-containing protein [Sanghuangporus baumii]